jgi:hypothetical protein
MDREKVGLSTKIEFALIKNGVAYGQVIRFSGEVDRGELAEVMRKNSEKAKEKGLRPGQVNNKQVISADKLAVLHCLTPDGNPPLDIPKENVVFFAQLPQTDAKKLSRKDYFYSPGKTVIIRK